MNPPVLVNGRNIGAGPLHPDASDAERAKAHRLLVKHFASIAAQLGDNLFLLGERMTIADCYLFWALRWAPIHGIELPESLQAYYERMRQAPSVAQALAEEGIA